MWLNWVIYIATGITAGGVIWKKALKPIVHGIATLESSLPVLLEIAAEFKHDEKPGSESLKDILTRMEKGLIENTGAIKLVQAHQETQGIKLDQLHDYSHAARHEAMNEMQKLQLQDELIKKKVDNLSDRTSARRHDDPTVTSPAPEPPPPISD